MSKKPNKTYRVYTDAGEPIVVNARHKKGALSVAYEAYPAKVNRNAARVEFMADGTSPHAINAMQGLDA